jgi:hypothetical protein
MRPPRNSAPPARFMVTPLTAGRAAIYMDDRVNAPCTGYKGVWPGAVAGINEEAKTLHIEFDDGDVDHHVPIGLVRHVRGASASLSKSRKRGAPALRPKERKLRLPQKPPRMAGEQEPRPWTHHGFTSMVLQPPCPGQLPYDGLAARTVFTFRWTWEGEATPAIFPASRIDKVTLHDMVNVVDSPYAGMHVAALNYFTMALAEGPPLAGAALAQACGTYDPYV